MIYHGTFFKESIVVHPENNEKNHQFVDFCKEDDVPAFSVYMFDDRGEWFWTFDMFNSSDYERIKFEVMSAIFKCDTMHELADMLDYIFHEHFAHILIEDDDETECDCSKCTCDCTGTLH